MKELTNKLPQHGGERSRVQEVPVLLEYPEESDLGSRGRTTTPTRLKDMLQDDFEDVVAARQTQEMVPHHVLKPEALSQFF